MSTKAQCTIHLLGRPMKLQCEPKEVPSLERAGMMLDAKMREFRDTHHIVGPERNAVFAALSMASDLIAHHELHSEGSENAEQRITALIEQVNAAIEQAP